MSMNTQECFPIQITPLFLAFSLIAIWGAPAFPDSGASGGVLWINNIEFAKTVSRRTRDYVNAEPMPLPRVSIDIESLPKGDIRDRKIDGDLNSSASPPLFDTDIFARTLYTSADLPTVYKYGIDETKQEDLADKDSKDRGEKGSFTSSRVFPSSLLLRWPYRAAGKLFMDVGNESGTCSAAVIAPRVILTAGHCVHSGNGSQSGWFSGFEFVPAYDSGFAPFGTWTWTTVYTTGEWFFGNGDLPAAADFAMIIIADQGGFRIGEVVGWFGWDGTDSLLDNHVTMLGFPINLDYGADMHRVNAGSYGAAPQANVIYGSDMGQGASGGPWVRDFGLRSVGQNFETNRI